MLNRYGPWLDINLVEPTGPQSCSVRFEYFLDQDFSADEGYVQESLAASETVQQEDVKLCESVQRGLRSPAYNMGRYIAADLALCSRWYHLEGNGTSAYSTSTLLYVLARTANIASRNVHCLDTLLVAACALVSLSMLSPNPAEFACSANAPYLIQFEFKLPACAPFQPVSLYSWSLHTTVNLLRHGEHTCSNLM